MTVSTTTSKVSNVGDGLTPFPVTFAFYADTDLEVIERTIATGAETTKTLTTDYTVSGGGGSTGTVTPVASVPASVEWHIRRALPKTQGTALPVAGALPSGNVEEMADRAVMLIQQLQEELDRCLKFPKSDGSLTTELDSSVDRASLFLNFDANGNVTVSAITNAMVSAFMTTVLDDTTASAALTTLGITTFIKTLLDDATAAAARSTLGLVIGTNVLPELAVVTQAAAEAGTATAEKIWTAQRVKQAIAALGSGVWDIIGTVVAANSGSLTVTGIDATAYDTIAVGVSDCVPASDGLDAQMFFGDSGGLDQGGSDYSYHIMNVSDAANTYVGAVDTANVGIVIAKGIGSSAGEGYGGLYFIHRPGDGTSRPMLSGTWAGLDGSTTPQGGFVVGVRNAVITLDRVAINFSGANIASGRLTVWGINHA